MNASPASSRGIGTIFLVALFASPWGLALATPLQAPGADAPPWVSWLPESAIAGGARGEGFALDAQGHPRVLAAVGGVLHYSWSDGVQWHDQLVGVGEFVNTDHSLAFDPNGILHAAVSTNPYTVDGGSLTYGTLQLSGAWTFERILSASPSVPVGMRSRLLFDASGAPHILYQEWSSHPRVKHAYKDANGWHVEQVDSDAAGDQSATLDAQGRMHVCYDITDGGATQEMYATRSPSSGWSRTTLDSNAGGACGLAFDPAGALHVVYAGVAGAARHATRSPNGAWTFEDVQPGPFGGVDIVLDAAARPHVALWRTGIGLSYATLDANGAWTMESVDLNDSGATPRILLDANGRPQIAYLHRTDQVDSALARPSSVGVATPLLAKVAGAVGQ